MHYISIERKKSDENRNNKKLKRINKPWALNYRWVRPIRLFKSPLDFCSLLSLCVCDVFVRTCTPMCTLLLKQFSLFIFIVFLLPLALLLQSSFGVIWLCNCNRANTIIRWKQTSVCYWCLKWWRFYQRGVFVVNSLVDRQIAFDGGKFATFWTFHKQFFKRLICKCAWWKKST